MSRLYTSGFESGAQEGITGGNFAAVSTPARSGSFAGRVTGLTIGQPAAAGLTGRNYYCRLWIRFPSAPSVNAYIIGCGVAGTSGVWARLNTDRTVSLVRGSTVVASSPALAVDTWHLLQLRFKIIVGTNDEGELFVNQTSVGSFIATSGLDSAPTITIGAQPTGTYTIYFDDVAFNDDQGSAENSFPDDNGVVVLLKPTSDSSIGSWVNGGNAVPLWDAVNNAPPVGASFANRSSTNLIYSATLDGAGAGYAAVMETYASKLSGVIKIVQPVVYHGSDSNSSPVTGVTGASNPAAAEVSGTGGGSAAGTFPSGWSYIQGTTVHGDIASGSRSTAPVMRVRRISTGGSTDTLVCMMGLVVEYVPSVTFTDTRSGSFVLSGSITESRVVTVTYSDTSSGTVALSGTRTENRAISDSASGSVALGGTSAESRTTSDAPSGSMGLGGVQSDSRAYTDTTVIATLHLNGTVVETWIAAATFNDSQIGTIRLTGSIAEAQDRLFNDVPTGSITLAGMVTEIYHVGGGFDLDLSGTIDESLHFHDNPTVNVPPGTFFGGGGTSEAHYDDSPTGAIMVRGFVKEPTQHGPRAIKGRIMTPANGRLTTSRTGRITSWQ